MSSNLELFEIGKGLDIDGIKIIYGRLPPDRSKDIDAAKVGSIYLESQSGEIYRKYVNALGSGAWKKVSEASAILTHLTNVTTKRILDQEYVDNAYSIKWLVEAHVVSSPTTRYVCEIAAMNNGSTVDDATTSDHTSYTLLGDLIPDLIFDVELDGTGVDQVLNLTVESLTNEVNCSARRIGLVSEAIAYSLSMNVATETTLGTVRLASLEDLRSEDPPSDKVITAPVLVVEFNDRLKLIHSGVQPVIDPLIKDYDFTYNPDYVRVYINRLKLRPDEFIATTGVYITILLDLDISDEIEVETIPQFNY